MKVKNHRQMMRSLTDPLNIPKLRALLEAHPVLTQEEFKARQNMAEGGVPQLVQPGPGRQGYSGRRFSPSSSKFHQMKDGTWKYITDKNEHITGEKKSDVIKKMEKRRQDYLKKLEVQKKATAKKMAKVKTTYEGAGKHLNKVTAGPGKNIYYRYAPVGGAKGEYNKVKHFKNKTDAKNWVKEAIESTGRITDEKFLELRNKHKVMNNLEFANFLNKKTDFKGIRGEKFTPYNVRNRQLSLDVGPTGYSLDFPYSKKDVLDTLGATEDGTAKIKAWKKAGSTEEGFKKLYKTASSIKTYQKAKAEGQFKTKEFLEKKRKQQAKYEGSEKGKVQRLKDLEKRGIFPGGDPELDLWRDLYGSSQTKNPRLVLKTKKPTPVVNKQGNKIIPWFTDDNFKKVKFLDTQTGKTITFNNLKKYLGEEKYNKVLQPYKDKYLIKDTEIMYKGQKRKVATLINEGVFGSPKDFPREGYFHVHHPAGKGKDPFFTQLASWDANKAEWRPRTQLMSQIKGAKDFGAKRKVVEEFIENIPEGIQTQPGKKIYGKDLPLSEKLRTAGKEADLLRSKNFRNFTVQTFKDAEIPCIKGVGGQCTRPEDYRKGFNEVVQRSVAGDKKALTKLQKFTQTMKKLKGPAKWTGYGLLAEIGFMVPFATADYASGESWKRIIGNASDLGFGPMFGQSEDEEIIANLPEDSLGAEAQEALAANTRLKALTDPNRNFPQGRIGMDPKRFQEAQTKTIEEADLDFLTKVTPFMEGPRNQYLNPLKLDEAFLDWEGAQNLVKKQKEQRIQERRDRGFIAEEGWEENFRGSRGYGTGGIVSLLKK
jgi:hypothetical protein